jgi:mono/diheme cytochrome c family protein
MRSAGARRLQPSVAVAALVLAAIAWVGAQQPAAAVYTAAQAAAGRTVYQASCASCHLPDLAGRNEAPQLAGNNFMNTWRARTTRDLFEFIQSTMPPTGETLSADQYLAVTAFILQANGARACARRRQREAIRCRHQLLAGRLLPFRGPRPGAVDAAGPTLADVAGRRRTRACWASRSRAR